MGGKPAGEAPPIVAPGVAVACVVGVTVGSRLALLLPELWLQAWKGLEGRLMVMHFQM